MARALSPKQVADGVRKSFKKDQEAFSGAAEDRTPESRNCARHLFKTLMSPWLMILAYSSLPSKGDTAFTKKKKVIAIAKKRSNQINVHQQMNG